MATQLPTLTNIGTFPQRNLPQDTYDNAARQSMTDISDMIGELNSDFIPNVNTFSTQVEGNVTTCANKAQEATTSAGTASDKAGVCTTKAGEASQSASDALGSAQRAEQAAQAAEAAVFLKSAILTPVSSSIMLGNTTKTVTVDTNSDGSLSVVSSNNNIVTASISGNVVTLTSGNTFGTATVTVSTAKTINYYATTSSIEVCSSPELENVSWAEISDIGSKGLGANLWDIGDTKSVLINGTIGTLSVNDTFKVMIIDFNYRGDNGVYFQGFKNSNNVDVALCSAGYGSFYSDGTKYFNMRHWGGTSISYNYGGWKGCDLRYDILGSTETAPSNYETTGSGSSRIGYNATVTAKTSPVPDTLMAALPSELRSVLSLWTVYTNNRGGESSNVETYVSASVDYLPLLAEFEVFGARSMANEYEQNKQAQMAYYANGNSPTKYNHNNESSICNWWLRSPYYNSKERFCVASSSASGSTSGTVRGLAPAFRLAEPAE